MRPRASIVCVSARWRSASESRRFWCKRRKIPLRYTEWRSQVVNEQIERFPGIVFGHMRWHTSCLLTMSRGCLRPWSDNSRDVTASSLLIVDDYPDALDVWGLYLRAEGFTVLTASDGQTAFAEALREKPDLIVMDLELPGKSGFEVARDLKARAGYAVRFP